MRVAPLALMAGKLLRSLMCGWHACAQFQAMLWRLLGHALDLSNPESDTLIEEALRLLVSVLHNATAFMPALQVRHLFSHPAETSCSSPDLHPATAFLCGFY